MMVMMIMILATMVILIMVLVLHSSLSMNLVFLVVLLTSLHTLGLTAALLRLQPLWSRGSLRWYLLWRLGVLARRLGRGAGEISANLRYLVWTNAR